MYRHMKLIFYTTLFSRTLMSLTVELQSFKILNFSKVKTKKNFKGVLKYRTCVNVLSYFTPLYT